MTIAVDLGRKATKQTKKAPLNNTAELKLTKTFKPRLFNNGRSKFQTELIDNLSQVIMI